MKISTLLFLFLTACILHAFTGRAAAQDSTLQLEIYSVPKITANRIMDDRRIIVEPQAALDALQRLKTAGQASLVTTQTVKGTLPLRTTSHEKVFMELDISSPAEGLVDLLIALNSGTEKLSAKLVTSATLKAGIPKFLGTLEPQGGKEKDKTWMVFIHLR